MAHEHIYLALPLEAINITVKEVLKSNPTIIANTYFSKKVYTNGPQAHEKMLNITSHQGNANQNHKEIHFVPIRVATIKQTK